MPRARKRPERPSKLDPFKRVILEQLEKNPSYNGELIFERIASMGYVGKNGDAFTEAGDQITFSADSGHYVRYRYDLWNRLDSVDKGAFGTASAAQVATYEYDPTGLRVGKTSATSRTEYVYGIDGNVLRETRYEATLDDVTIDYVYALGRLAGWTETTGGMTTKYWAATDHLGSVTAATDSGGNLAMRRDFSAFGDSMDAALETGAGPRYTGKDFDEDAELYYFNARWYDPELGRFTTEDPIKDGTNWYAYVNNGPLNFTDPSGTVIESINSIYAMNQENQPWSNESVKLGKSTSSKFRLEGCLVTTDANVIRTFRPFLDVTPKTLNDKRDDYFNLESPSEINSKDVMEDYGLVYKHGGDALSGSENMDLIIQLRDAEDEYGIIVKVHYKMRRKTE